MPQIKNIVETAFNAIKDVVNIVWNIFENLLLPILKLLWKFIEPTFPLIGTIIKTAFDIVIKVVEGVISVFETVTSVISTAVGWLTDWNDKDVKDKNVNMNTNYTSSGGGMTGGIPKYASGTDFHPGGMAIVGENGAELINLPRGSSVKTAEETANMRGVNISFEGANFSVRNDNDIKEIAKELGDYINSAGRRRGYA